MDDWGQVNPPPDCQCGRVCHAESGSGVWRCAFCDSSVKDRWAVTLKWLRYRQCILDNMPIDKGRRKDVPS